MRRTEFCCWVRTPRHARPLPCALLRLAAVACAALVPVSCWLGSPFSARVLVAGLGIGLWARARGMSGRGEEDVLVRATLAVDGDVATLGLPASVGGGAKGSASLEPTGDLVVAGRRATPVSEEARASVRRLLEEEAGLQGPLKGKQ